MENKKLFHLHLQDSMGNKKTLIAKLINGSIDYIFYGGTSSSGTPFSIRNIQFYDIIDRNIRWVRDRSLPIDNEYDESVEQFKKRVIKMLNNSTYKVIKDVNVNVNFK